MYQLARVPVLALLLCAVPGCEAPPAPPEAPLDRVAGALLDLFPEIDLLCLGEQHGSVEDAQLREALVRHPTFVERVDVVVVEFINPLHQAVVDRLVRGGEVVSRDELRPAWLDAGLGAYWDLPHYEAFLRSVAEVNRDLATDRKIPVVGLAMPIPWSTIDNPEALLAYLDRQRHYADRVGELVLDPGLRGVAVFGAGHCERRGMGFPALLETEQRQRVAAVVPLPSASRSKAQRLGIALGDDPSFLPIAGTSRSDLPAGDLLFEGHAVAEWKLGEIVDGLFDAGAAPPTILPPDEASLEGETRLELDRRTELLSTARALEGDGASPSSQRMNPTSDHE